MPLISLQCFHSSLGKRKNWQLESGSDTQHCLGLLGLITNSQFSAVSLLSPELVHVQLGIHLYLQVFYSKAAFQLYNLQAVLIPGVLPPQGKNLTFPSVELHDVCVVSCLQPDDVPLKASSTILSFQNWTFYKKKLPHNSLFRKPLSCLSPNFFSL